ncbi:MAG: alpha/beta hydrolase-fold protein [Psychrosphaera sp.]|nr:alpha/beta hydrolase-fold protein [Psychrosphaera sp.]
MKTIIKNSVLLITLLLPLLAHSGDIYVHYDTGWGNNITLRGDGGGLNWSSGKAAQWTNGNAWHISTPPSGGGFQFKPLLNDQDWSIGANYSVPDGASQVHVWPFFNHNGSSLIQFNFTSQTLGNTRTIRVLLPPSYNENSLKSYPVLYMHDGQNLFSASTASFGVEWQVDETSESLIYQGAMAEAIIVGMDNTGAARIDEYTPTVDADYGGGNGDAYLDFIETELMPYIESNYRVKTGPENTLMMGSSLGGLISFYAGWTRSHVYGRIASMSGSFWWNNEDLTNTVQNHTGALINSNFYVDTGALESSAWATVDMANAMINKGYVLGQNLYYYKDSNGAHTESSWQGRLNLPLQYLLPWQ